MSEEAGKPDFTEGGKHPHARIERRTVKAPMSDSRITLIFTMLLSIFLLFITSIGAFFVLLEPDITYTIGGATIKIGGYKYPDIIKGSVLTLVMIGGFTAVVTFWLRISNTEAKAQEANTAIASNAAPAAAQSAKETINVLAALPPLPDAKPKDGVVTPAPKDADGDTPALKVAEPDGKG